MHWQLVARYSTVNSTDFLKCWGSCILNKVNLIFFYLFSLKQPSGGAIVVANFVLRRMVISLTFLFNKILQTLSYNCCTFKAVPVNAI